MDLHPQPHPVALSFRVRYHAFLATTHNSLLKGAGELTVDQVAGRLTFEGRARRIFGQSKQVTFALKDVGNVVRAERRLQFTSTEVNVKGSNKPFIFFCETEAEALRLQALLPQAVDENVRGQLWFAEKLTALSGNVPWYASVTGLLIALNIVVFAAMAAFCGAGWFTVDNMEPYLDFGANNGAATTDGEWWRLLTSMFVHYGLLHLVMNMWALLNLGRVLEKIAGRALFAAIYFGSGIGAGLCSITWHRDQVWSAGASGAIFGLLGATLGYIVREKKALPASVFKPMLKSSLIFAGYNLLYGAASQQIDNGAHVGGLVCGFLLGWGSALPLDLELRQRLWGSRFKVALVVSVAIIALGVGLAPRFDYRFKEERAWATIFQAFATKENPLLLKEGRAVQQFERSPTTAPVLIALAEKELLPAYTQLRADLNALSLSPSLRTERRRAVALKFITLRMSALVSLVDEAANGNLRTLDTYKLRQSEAGKVLADFAAIK